VPLLVKPEPVTEGDFADGPDVMLWNPALTAKRWRSVSIYAFVARCCTTQFVIGLLVLALGIRIAESISGALLVGGAGALVLSCLCDAAMTVICLDTDHSHPRGRPCRLERSPGEFFLRGRDFADLGPRAHYAAKQLIDLTGELHSTVVRGWLPSGLPEKANQLAWEALIRLDRSRTARQNGDKLAEVPGEAELASAVAAAVEKFDDDLDELIFELQSCATLTRAWEAKLRHDQFVGHAVVVQDELQAASIGPVVALAEELPRSVFAYVTAARDLMAAGPFPWEVQTSTGEAAR
jgi:hypothetical protein